MLFRKSFAEGIVDGRIRSSVRSWKSPRVRVGGRYRLYVGGEIEVTQLRAIDVGEIDAELATASGFDTVGALLEELRRQGGEGALRSLFRIDFSYSPQVTPPPQPELSVGETVEKLAKMDARSATGPWTGKVLRLIEATPGRRAGDLAPEIGRELVAFKRDVRKLKKLGLTESLEVGYRLSRFGQKVVDRLGE